MISERDYLVGVGKRLRQLREAMKKTQAELGDKLHVGASAISNYELGDRALDPYSAFQLKLTYGAPLEWLYGGDESVIPAALADKLAKAASEQRKPRAKRPARGPLPRTAKTAEMV